MGEGRIRRYRRCNKCGLEEETEDNHFADVGKMAEPTDNTKIEELDKVEENLCPCDEFITTGECHCKLWVKK